MQAGIYKHYKGGYYLLFGVGEHTETKERLVVYIALSPFQPGPRIRIRPFDGPEGFTTPPEGFERRFVHIGDEVIPHEDPPVVKRQ